MNTIELLDDNFQTLSNQSREIPQEHLAVLQILKNILGSDFYITGSLSLYLYGVIDRPIKDLDIILSVGNKKQFYEKIAHILTSNQSKNGGLDGEEEGSNDDNSFECNLKINGIKIDVFKFDVNPVRIEDRLPSNWVENIVQDLKIVQLKSINIQGFKVLEPKPSIDAKLKYISFFMGHPMLSEKKRTNLKKHLFDVSEYYLWLNTKY